MSALEQALRHIDEQRLNNRKTPSTPSKPTMMALPSEPLLAHTVLRWLPRVALLLAAAGSGYWAYRTGGFPSIGNLPSGTTVATTAVPATQPAPPPVSPPVVTASPAPSAMAVPGNTAPALFNPPALPRPEGFDRAVQAWTSGQHATAAQLWMDALRRLPPSTMALLLAEPETPEQVNNAVLSQAAVLPWLVIPGAGRWTVLVLTPAAELDRTHAWLAREGRPALPWGTVAHWVARSETSAAAPPPPGPPAARPVAAPAAPVPPAVRPVASAPGKVPAGPASAPVTPPPAPKGEAPQLSRSAASEPQATTDNGAPSAARSIESEFAAVEQDLAAARYDAALRRVGQLESTIGPNWRTRYLSGVALSGLQRWQEAVPMLTLARQGNAGHARLALYLSVAQQEIGQHAAAIETLDHALGSHADMPELWLNKAHSLQALNRGEETAFHYRRFLELSINRQDLSAQRAWVHKLLDQKASAW